MAKPEPTMKICVNNHISIKFYSIALEKTNFEFLISSHSMFKFLLFLFFILFQLKISLEGWRNPNYIMLHTPFLTLLLHKMHILPLSLHYVL